MKTEEENELLIKWLIKKIVRRELNKIEAHSEAQFYDICCNKYNNREEFVKK